MTNFQNPGNSVQALTLFLDSFFPSNKLILSYLSKLDMEGVK